MRTTPKPPKLLPWLARKAGISDVRAECLWRDAERWAAHRATAGSSPYYQAAVDRLVQLVAEDSLRADAASFGWRPWSRAQARAWAVSMQVMHELSAISARGWAMLDGPARRQRIPG